MCTSHLSSLFIIFILYWLPVFRGTAYAADDNKKAVPIAIKAHYESPPDHVEMVPPCASWTSVPTQGICRASGQSTRPTTFTGDWRGRLEYAFGFLILPSGLSYNSEVNHFTGTIRGCGKDTMVYQDQIISDTKGA